MKTLFPVISQDNGKVSDQNNLGNTKMKVAILGDSMIKHINGWKVSTKLEEFC